MSGPSFEPPGGVALSGLASDFRVLSGSDLGVRWAPHRTYWEARLAAGLDPYCRTLEERIGPEAVVRTRGQERMYGVNFASHDCLSLGSHPKIVAAATEAMARWGVHGGGSASRQGATLPLSLLEERISEFLSCGETVVFPTGWAAAYGALRTLVGENDHVVIDVGAAPYLIEGATAATRNVHRVGHCSLQGTQEALRHIRDRDSDCAIMVVTQAFFPREASVPDLRGLLTACRERDAVLLVSVAEDLGAIGEGGTGFVGEAGLAGEIDLVVGSLSRTFVSAGGFVATRLAGIGHALRTFCEPLVSSCTLSPVQAAIAHAALDIVRGPEGGERRAHLMRHVMGLRGALAARAFRVMGQPGPSVPVWLGSTEDARLMTRAVLAGGGLVDLLESPDVPDGEARWCLYPMADHDDVHIVLMANVAHAARETTGLTPPPPRPLPSDTLIGTV